VEISRKSGSALVKAPAARYRFPFDGLVFSRLEPGPSIIHALVSSIWEAALRHLADVGVARQATEAGLRARGRRLLTRLDQTDPARAQLRTLLGLVHQARATQFGRAHDFRRIRTAADYRRLVPLTTPAGLWREAWDPALPHVAGATWPALPSAALRAANAAALRTAFALALHALPRARLLGGRTVWLSDDIALSPEPANPTPRARDAFGPACLPWEVRPHAAAHPDAAAPLTCVAGSAARLLKLFEQARCATGRARVTDVWPGLAVAFYSRRLTDPDAAALRAELGDRVLLLEVAALREGVVAVEDPRYGLPRLLTDHGLYFEFVPAAEAHRPDAPRLGIEGVECGAPYEVALTSPAGVWACRVGMTVQFERRGPFLLRLVAAPPVPSSEAVARSDEPEEVTSPASRRRTADTPAARPESIAHTPWLVPADRG
jgi:hypothetical protein